MKHLSEIVEAAKARGRKRLAVAYGQDSHTIAAVYDAYNEGLVEPIIYGDRIVIEKVCKELNIDSCIFRIIDEPNDVKAATLAAKAVAQGDTDVLMKGMIPTDKYMRAILNKDLDLCPPKGVLSHVSVFEWSGYHKLLLASDIAIILQPDIKQKQKQIEYLRKVANMLGVEVPKIGCIAPSEQVLPTSLSSSEGAMLAKMADRGQLGNVIVDGPLSLDVALFKDVAEHKKVKGSSVAGDVDALLFPNIESGNVFFKSVSHLACGEIAAIVMGAKVPCVLTSRGDSALSKKYSIALACLAAK